MKLKGNQNQQASTEIPAYELRFNFPKLYVMYSNFLSGWVLSLCNFQNSRFESCVVLLEHETKSVSQ